MFGVPYWFYQNLGYFPPFNRHYMGDTASFLLPLAVGLMIAAQNVARYRLIIAIGAAASIIHTLNHFYDPLLEGYLTTPMITSWNAHRLRYICLGLHDHDRRDGQGGVSIERDNFEPGG